MEVVRGREAKGMTGRATARRDRASTERRRRIEGAIVERGDIWWCLMVGFDTRALSGLALGGLLWIKFIRTGPASSKPGRFADLIQIPHVCCNYLEVS